jgi:ankyrin repeat protein
MPAQPPTFGFVSSPSNAQSTYTTSQTIDESTPFIAASDGDLPLLQHALITLNIPVNTADSNGLTLLHSAASYNQIEIMSWLFTQQSIDVNAKDNDGDTPLHHCDNLQAMKMLIEEGKANWKIDNDEGNNVLEMKEEELREIFVSNKEEDIDSDDEDVENLQEIIKYLKELGNRSS